MEVKTTISNNKNLFESVYNDLLNDSFVLENYLVPQNNITKSSNVNVLSESIVSRNIITSPIIKKEYGFIDDKGLYNHILELHGYRDKFRGRSELLILDKDKVYLSLTDKENLAGFYKLPGGGWDKDEEHHLSAKREAQEESRINIKNIKYGGTYITLFDEPQIWVKKKVSNPKDQWCGYYTEVYIAEYDGRYNGHIDDIDKDNIINTGKFYNISDVYDRLHPIHANAIKSYGNLSVATLLNLKSR